MPPVPDRQVAVCNEKGEPLYVRYVIPTEDVIDYRAHITGIRPHHLEKINGAVSFEEAQQKVAKLVLPRDLACPHLTTVSDAPGADSRQKAGRARRQERPLSSVALAPAQRAPGHGDASSHHHHHHPFLLSHPLAATLCPFLRRVRPHGRSPFHLSHPLKASSALTRRTTRSGKT